MSSDLILFFSKIPSILRSPRKLKFLCNTNHMFFLVNNHMVFYLTCKSEHEREERGGAGLFLFLMGNHKIFYYGIVAQ
jgi:hypothetical protein